MRELVHRARASGKDLTLILRRARAGRGRADPGRRRQHHARRRAGGGRASGAARTRRDAAAQRMEDRAGRVARADRRSAARDGRIAGRTLRARVEQRLREAQRHRVRRGAGHGGAAARARSRVGRHGVAPGRQAALRVRRGEQHRPRADVRERAGPLAARISCSALRWRRRVRAPTGPTRSRRVSSAAWPSVLDGARVFAVHVLGQKISMVDVRTGRVLRTVRRCAGRGRTRAWCRPTARRSSSRSVAARRCCSSTRKRSTRAARSWSASTRIRWPSRRTANGCSWRARTPTRCGRLTSRASPRGGADRRSRCTPGAPPGSTPNGASLSPDGTHLAGG